MVGGRLDATFQSGNLKAWFDAHADVIVRWKPFWFDADIGITIGASYKIDLLFTTATLSIELDAILSSGTADRWRGHCRLVHHLLHDSIRIVEVIRPGGPGLERC